MPATDPNVWALRWRLPVEPQPALSHLSIVGFAGLKVPFLLGTTLSPALCGSTEKGWSLDFVLNGCYSWSATYLIKGGLWGLKEAGCSLRNRHKMIE